LRPLAAHFPGAGAGVDRNLHIAKQEVTHCGNLFMAHRCGFTAKVLIAALRAAGFTSVACTKRAAPFFDLYAVATREPSSREVLEQLALAHFPKRT
jgi:hypothetical protein